MEITAAVLRDPDQPYRLERVELASPLPDEVLVRIVGAGYCHTDVLPRSPELAGMAPIITGHEGSGVVEAIGVEVTTIQVGDHVVLTFDLCGRCPTCDSGHPAYCETFIFRNLSGRRVDGSTSVIAAGGEEIASRWFAQSSFATHAIARERNAVVVDKALPLALLGPLGCGIQTGAGSILRALSVQPDTSVLVTGAGAVGLAGVMAARVAGADTIIAVDLHDTRLDLALELGAHHVVRGGDPNLVSKVLDWTRGGAHTALDTTGVPAVILQALASLRMTGRLGLVGVQTADLVLDALATPGKTIFGILEGDVDPKLFIPELISLWQDGQFPFDRLIEAFPFAEIDDAEAASLSGRVIKPVLHIGT